MLTSVTSHLFTVAVFICNYLPSVSYRDLSVTQGFACVLLETPQLSSHPGHVTFEMSQGCHSQTCPDQPSSRLQQFIVHWCEDALMSCCWWWSADCSLSCRVIVKLLLLLYTVVLTQLKPEKVFFFLFFFWRNMRNHIFVVSSYLFVCLSSLGRFSDFPWVKRGPGCLFYGKASF